MPRVVADARTLGDESNLLAPEVTTQRWDESVGLVTPHVERQGFADCHPPHPRCPWFTPLYGCIAVLAAGLGLAYPDRGQRLLAVYAACLIADEWVLSGVVFSLAPNFAYGRAVFVSF